MSFNVSKYRKRYIIFISTIVILIIASQAIIQFDIRQQYGDAQHINEAGKQRMLSQRISKLVLYLEQDIEKYGVAKLEHLDSLSKLIDKWEHVHFSLLASSAEAKNPLIDSLLHSLTGPLVKMINVCRDILAEPSEEKIRNAIEVISANELIFLLAMDKTVNAYQKDSEEKLRLLKNIELFLAAIALLVLSIEFVWLFIPIIRGLRKSVSDLQSLNEELSSNKNELSNKLNEIQYLHEKLEKREKTFREIIEQAEDIIFELDKDGNFTYLNPSSKALFEKVGLTYTEGKSKIQDIIRPDKRDEALRFIRHQVKNLTQNCYSEYPLIEADSKQYWLGLNMQIEYQHKIPQKIKIIARDITAVKETQHYLQLAKDNAEQLTMAKAQFLSNMSHEIRTPMNAIIGLSHLLLIEKPRPDQQENLRLIKFSAEHLLGIINDILDVSKIDAGKVELEKSVFNLVDLVKNLVMTLQLSSKNKNVETRLIIDSQVPTFVYGDQLRLSQVLHNILGNALKFTAEGYVELKIGMAETAQRNLIRFDISDTGIGIDESKINLIFESFTQASPDTSSKYGGTGLGLSISKKLIEIMGGNVSVRSTPGKGSIFTFTALLPAGEHMQDSDKGEKKLYPNTEISSQSLINRHILVAEDNSANQIVIKKFLEKWGASYDIAHNGIEAVDLIKKKSYDLVLMDIQMPLMNGYEAAAAIRNLPDDYFKSIPIIALTADVTAEILELVRNSGMNDAITKPFQPEQLKNTLDYFCARQNATAAKTELSKALDVYAEGDETFKSELIQLLTKNLHELEAAYETALREHNLEVLKSASHKVKASLEIIGAQEIYLQARAHYEAAEMYIEEDVKTERLKKFKALTQKWIKALNAEV
ncbi:MAG TPA: ATP-binding protein [Cyclobacteriaceae bacterium]|nr:ATP-binding protein [Cyclobacteriaceae bacterium]